MNRHRAKRLRAAPPKGGRRRKPTGGMPRRPNRTKTKED